MDQHTQPGPAAPAESFPTDPAGLPEATRPALLELGLHRIELSCECRQLLRRWLVDRRLEIPAADLSRRRALGVGLSNIERRLQRYFDGRGGVTIASTYGVGTVVELTVPVAA